jgi:hypothetical protein
MSTRFAVRVGLVPAVAALWLVLAPAALAGKPGGGSGGGSSSIRLVLLNSTDGLAHYGQMVTFNLSTVVTSEPWVDLKCYQNGVLVSEGWNGFFASSLTGEDFGLYSPQWSGGAADCTASLDTYSSRRRWTLLASTSFHVYP